MKVELSRIENEPLSFDEELSIAPERLDTVQVEGVTPVRLVATIQRQLVGYRLEGRVVGRAALACDRCLARVDWSCDESFSVELRPGSTLVADDEVGLADDDLEVTFVEGDELDTEDVAVEQLLLALPMRVLCRDDCAGLCPSCGGNRNEPGACRCEPEGDPRWDALRDLSGAKS